jgi:uncharacterized membrane protein YjjP (DUF1212 family)
MDIGEQMLISGAEVRRVEEGIKRMCCSFGANRTDVFIITSSMVVTVFLSSYLAVKLNIIADADKVIIGNIMSLIPGIGLTNALRDLFSGDSIAGLLRAVEVLLTALAIAAGYFLITILGGFLI